MPSPFPGMNPYLEQQDTWRDFHNSMIPAIRDVIRPQVSPGYIVKIEEQLFIREPSAEQRFLFGYADVGLAKPKITGESSGAIATISSPLIERIPSVDFEKHIFLEIRDRITNELVTVLELLSPSNKKPGIDREQYLAKRVHLLHSEANFVEIDLLRGWGRMPMEKPTSGDYSIMVSRVEDRPDANYWPLSLRDPLPTIPIPLRSRHPNATVDLQSVLNDVYDRAGYGDYIYAKNPFPPLSLEDSDCAVSLILQKEGSGS